MRIEEGKFYRTRDGRKVGPVRATGNIFWPMKCEGTWWRENGESCEGSMGRMGRMYPRNDIISEWVEADAQWFLDTPARPSPIVTEMVRRIESGVYGPLEVGAEVSIPDCERPDQPPPREIEAYLTKSCLDAQDWREMARVALEIAEYLDAQ